MPRRSPAAPTRHGSALWLSGAGLVLILVVLVLRMDEVCGAYSDDAWYVLLAKAIATGHGYSLINGPTPGVLPYFPPGFPWLLSLVFLVAPVFPANLWLLKSTSIVAMLGTAVLAQRYAARELGLAAPIAGALALATALHPGLVFLATSTVMSECVFTLVQLAAVLLLERAGRDSSPGWIAPAAGLLAGFGCLVRSVGAALVLAGVLFLLKQRRWRGAALFALASLALAGPWQLYARTHVPNPAVRAEMNDAIVIPYGDHFWLRETQDPSLGMISASELPARMWSGMQSLVRSAVGALPFYPLYQLLDPGGWAGPAPGATAVSVTVCVVVAIGFVAAVRRRIGVAEILTPLTMLTVTLWGTSTYRLVLPLLPFVLGYAVFGVGAIACRLGARRGDGPALVALALVLVVSVASHASYVWQLYGPPNERPVFVQLFHEMLDVIGWARDHVPPDQVVTAIHPAITYLYSGHQTVGYNEPEGSWAQWRRLGIHYLVETSYVGHLSTLAEGRFTTVHRSPQIGMRVLELGRIYAPH